MVSNKSTEELLNDLRAVKFEGYIPVIVYVAVIMTVGIIGNVLTGVYYGRGNKQTAAKRLIFSLAVTDTVMCALMSTNFVDMRYVYAMESRVYCKTSFFLSHLIGLVSVLILNSIVVFRYQSICNPFGTRFTVRHINIAIALSCAFAVMESAPTLLTRDSVALNVTVSSNITVTVHDCGVSKQDWLVTLNSVVNALDGLIFVSTLMTLSILYTRIAGTIWKLGASTTMRHDIRQGSNIGTTSDATGTNLAMTTSDCVRDSQPSTTGLRASEEISTDDTSDLQTNTAASTHSTAPVINAYKNHIQTFNVPEMEGDNQNDVIANVTMTHDTFTRRSTKIRRKSLTSKTTPLNSPRSVRSSDRSSNYTRMTFVITLAFVFSFVPYFGIALRDIFGEDNIDDDRETWVRFVKRSYMLSSAANPFIYGYYNPGFRLFILNVFKYLRNPLRNE